MKNLKTLGIAGGLVAAALVGSTLISAAAASPAASVAPTTDTTVANATNLAAYCAVWQQTFATQLGVSVDKLVPAAKAATLAAIDAAVKNGDLSADVAARLKTHINAANGDGCRLLGGFLSGIGRHGVRADARHDVLGAAATALKMTPDQLFSALRSGKDLKQIAADQKVDYATVTKAILAAAKSDLGALVSSGHLTQARADAILSRLSDALASGHFFGPGGFRQR
ncbi:MAG TPA: hypothetical protein VK600_01780 [Candidatus Saccharimonadales bacterium]|nr:hypothetical protein [Candidatus Saccharimonadales bacterium]